MKVKSLSRVGLLGTPWTEAHQAPLSMGFFQARVMEWVAIAFSILKTVILILHLGFSGGSGVKICLPMQETCTPFLGQERLLEKEMATHSSILAWEIPWKRNLAGYSTWGHKRVGHSLMTKQEQNFAFPVTFSTMLRMYFMLYRYL